MLEDGKIFIGKGTKPEYLDLRLANRHGLVTGATGTGKTVSAMAIKALRLARSMAVPVEFQLVMQSMKNMNLSYLM